MENKSKLIYTMLFFIFIVSSCERTSTANYKQKVIYNSFYGGNHELRKFSSQERTTAATASASYFLFWGSASLKGEEKTSVIAFSWQSKSGEFILTKIPMTKVRVKFDNENKSPYITFSIDYPDYTESTNPDENVEYIMEYRLNYVIVHCKESDYPTDVNIKELN